MTSVHFGLGQATQVDQVEIHRPNGRITRRGP
ncbi:MAG: ASPIC/UnbV domain-containing protein [Terracidiphilus sp.]